MSDLYVSHLLSHVSEHTSTVYGLVDNKMRSQSDHHVFPFTAQVWTKFVHNIYMLMGRDMYPPYILVSRTG